jgi:hypothetical protein
MEAAARRGEKPAEKRRYAAKMRETVANGFSNSPAPKSAGLLLVRLYHLGHFSLAGSLALRKVGLLS